MKSYSLPILILLSLGSAQAITQTISREGVVYADLESFARDIGAGMATGSSTPLVWRLAAKGKDMVLVQDSNLAQLNGQRYQMAGKTLLEGGKGYAPLDSLRALFQVNVATQSAGSGSSGSSSSGAGSSSANTAHTSSSGSGAASVQQPDFSHEQILAAVNGVRAQARKCGDKAYPAVGPLRWNTLLEQSALKHSRNMAENQFFAHDDPQGRDPYERILSEGFIGKTGGENIASYFTEDPKKVLAGWVASPGHCANLMNPRYTQFGLGVYFLPYSEDKEYLHLWTQNFGG